MRALPPASTRQANTGPGPVATTARRTTLDEDEDDFFFLVAFFFLDDDAVVVDGTGVVVVRLVCVPLVAALSPPSPPAPLPSRYRAPTSRTRITPTTTPTGMRRGSRGGPIRPAPRPPRPPPRRRGAPIGIRSWSDGRSWRSLYSSSSSLASRSSASA